MCEILISVEPKLRKAIPGISVIGEEENFEPSDEKALGMLTIEDSWLNINLLIHNHIMIISTKELNLLETACPGDPARWDRYHSLIQIHSTSL